MVWSALIFPGWKPNFQGYLKNYEVAAYKDIFEVTCDIFKKFISQSGFFSSELWNRICKDDSN